MTAMKTYLEANMTMGSKTRLGSVIGFWPLAAGWTLVEIAYAPGKTILARIPPQ